MSNLCRELKVKARRCIMYLSFAHTLFVPSPKRLVLKKHFQMLERESYLVSDAVKFGNRAFQLNTAAVKKWHLETLVEKVICGQIDSHGRGLGETTWRWFCRPATSSINQFKDLSCLWWPLTSCNKSSLTNWKLARWIFNFDFRRCKGIKE